MTFLVKKLPKLILFQEEKTIWRDSFKILTEKNAQPDARHQPVAYNIQLHTIPILNSQMRLLIKTTWPENHHPTFILFLQHQCFFPVDINFGWPRKSLTHPYQHKYWNILFPDSTPSQRIKFPKINSFLSIQRRTFFFSISHTFSHSWTQLCFLFANTIHKFFTCLLIWIATLCFCHFFVTIRLI